MLHLWSNCLAFSRQEKSLTGQCGQPCRGNTSNSGTHIFSNVWAVYTLVTLGFQATWGIYSLLHQTGLEVEIAFNLEAR